MPGRPPHDDTNNDTNTNSSTHNNTNHTDHNSSNNNNNNSNEYKLSPRPTLSPREVPGGVRVASVVDDI